MRWFSSRILLVRQITRRNNPECLESTVVLSPTFWPNIQLAVGEFVGLTPFQLLSELSQSTQAELRHVTDIKHKSLESHSWYRFPTYKYSSDKRLRKTPDDKLLKAFPLRLLLVNTKMRWVRKTKKKGFGV